MRTYLVIPIVLIALASLLSCNTSSERRVETEFLLGTSISVTTYGRANDGLFEQIFARVKEIEERMSTSEEDYETTELLRVNRAAGRRGIAVSPDTLLVMEQALEYSRLSGGAFDVTIGPLVASWGIGTDSPRVPSQERIDALVALVDHTAVSLDPEASSIFLPTEGMRVDVGGIAKGYAADEAARILSESGIESALLDFGGNILVVGGKPDGTPWRIGIQAPDERRGQFLGIAEIRDQAVVTSGTYERFFVQNGQRYHHIIDSSTGYPVENGLASVTIVTPQSMRADALSTAAFAMGLEAGLAFIESQEEIEAAFVTQGNEVYLTSGMGAFFELTNEAYALVAEG